MKKEPQVIQQLEKIEAKEEKSVKRFLRSPKFKITVLFIVLILACFGIIYWVIVSGRVAIDKADIEAPIISLTTQAPGILEHVYVKEGDVVSENMVVAMVNGVPIKALTSGIVISVQNTPGQFVGSQNPIVQMVDPTEFQVVGQVQENKGLSDIKLGQKVIFTVDAFGSKQYSAVVSSISPTARTSDIVFSISDQREEKEFDISAKFDVNSYPELKNGMSARMWIYK